MKFKDKRGAGEIGQTITWVVATLIILAMLIISVFATTLLFKAKQVVNVVNAFGTPLFMNDVDLLATKSFQSFVFTKLNSQTVYQQIKNEGNLNEGNANLAKSIFEKLYGEQYKIIWLTVYSKPQNLVHNIYFPKPPACGTGISNEIKLNAEKYLLLTLTTNC